MALQCRPSQMGVCLTAFLALLSCGMGFQPRYMASQKQLASKKNGDSMLNKEKGVALQEALLDTNNEEDTHTIDGDGT